MNYKNIIRALYPNVFKIDRIGDMYFMDSDISGFPLTIECRSSLGIDWFKIESSGLDDIDYVGIGILENEVKATLVVTEDKQLSLKSCVDLFDNDIKIIYQLKGNNDQLVDVCFDESEIRRKFTIENIIEDEPSI